MAKVGTWLPLYVADYQADTQRLTCEQHGAYLLLIMDYWRNGPPPDDDEVLVQIVKLDRARWRKHRPVLARMFQITDGEWRHKRIEAELENAKAHSDRRTESAKKAAAARWNASDVDAERNAQRMRDALPGECAPPSPSPSPSQGEEVGLEKTPLPHGALAFSGRIIRLNQRDFDTWQQSYHGIPDLRAELVALDDWLRDLDDPRTVKSWFKVVSGALAKKHQAAIRTKQEAASDERSAMPLA